MSPEELEKKFGHLPKEKASAPVSTDKIKLAAQKFKQLPPDRQDDIKRLLQKSCSSCEKEIGIGNVGVSHGLCPRHAEEYFRELGKPVPDVENNTPDLKKFPMEDLMIAKYLTTLVLKRDKKHSAARSDANYGTMN